MSVLRFGVFFLSLILFPSFVFSATPSTCANIEEIKSKYFAQNQYNEFIDELNNFKSQDNQILPCLDYYKALGRYQQLKYLEEKQSWDDYFANGNVYREQIVENTKKVLEQVSSSSSLKLKSRLLLWQFHHDQQDAFNDQALVDLMAELDAYAKEASDPVLIKDIADKLSAYEEKSKAKLAYKLYVDKLVAGQITEAQLKKIAADFYKDGNLELSMDIYDVYIEKISKTLAPEKFIQELFEIASLFVYKPQGFFDMGYAENIYSKIEALKQDNAFNQESIYLRAFNLEKFRDYKKAAELYAQLIKNYPGTKHYDEAVYKIAMINAYALADLVKAKEYFGILAVKATFSPHVISSIYQLGLLAQWGGDLKPAQDYYNQLLKKSADNYVSITADAKERLKEIEENKPLSHNLKTFLDLSSNSNNALIEVGKTELKVSNYILEKNQKFTISSLISMPQSGCNQVQLQYLWSGQLGGSSLGAEEGDFEGAYSDAGTKAVNIIIISPAGAIDRSFVMIDVY
ncbi:MAG: tetratricopeptide repeat protein [Candidatus Omnitrophota bacterium]